MEQALAGVSGVQSAKCNFSDETAQVVVAAGKEVDRKALLDALTAAGFGGTIVE